MWLTEFLNGGRKRTVAAKGSVTSSSLKNLEVDSSSQHRNVRVVAPYGVASIPPVDEDALVVPFEGGEACVGVITNPSEKIEYGELMLYSKGGASIILKNDGSVLINGKRVEL